MMTTGHKTSGTGPFRRARGLLASALLAGALIVPSIAMAQQTKPQAQPAKHDSTKAHAPVAKAPTTAAKPKTTAQTAHADSMAKHKRATKKAPAHKG